jgi:RHS repeat-associated protein
MFLDDQLKESPGTGATLSTNSLPVTTADILGNLNYTGAVMPKNGYIMIWVANTTANWDVFFDNLVVKHYNSPLLEETHYYPFGLAMAAISSRTVKLNNKFEFGGKEKQEKEFTDGSGLELYDFGARMLDPQIGRWSCVDPLAHMFPYQTPYSAMDNNPISKIDPTGMSAGDFYDTDGNHLGSDGIDDDKAYVADSKNADGTFKNAKELSVSNSVLNQFANTIAVESGAEKSGSWQESYGVGLAIRNIATAKNKTISSTLQTEGIFGFRDGGNSKAYKNNSEFSMQAALYSVMGGKDFTNGATKWDGIDFLAWGLNSPNGTPHNKFEEYGAIYIEASIYSSFKNSITNTMGNSVRYSGKSYSLPASVYKNMSNWKMPSLSAPWFGFMYNTGVRTRNSLDATASLGNTIFWKVIKE